MQITPATTVKDILDRHPHLFSIFEARGMCEDCKVSPPPVPVGHFAMKHCGGDIEGLLAELERNI